MPSGLALPKGCAICRWGNGPGRCDQAMAGIWSGWTRTSPPVMPPFEAVRDYVARQYEYYTVLDAQDRVYHELLGNYDVSITAEGIPPEVLNGLPAQ